MEINGAEAVVTGAAGGLGSAIARALHARGARLILTGRREEALNSLASQLNGAEVFVCDLAERGQIAGLIARLADTDIVVANAALPATGRLDDFTPDDLDRALDVNLRVPMLMTQQLLPGMLQRRRGHFVYISSISGKLPTARAPIYAATKYGLRGFCASLRQDLHDTEVSASVIFPGSVIDAGMLADAHIPAAPGGKGVSSDTVAGCVIAAIEEDRGEIDAADLAVRILAKFGGTAPGLIAHLTRRKDAIAYADQLSERLRHLR